jgi:crotonobetainyl-CoA:carnitine CoA-transferase CaiB-like acyl-CoA transferase
VQDEQQWRTLCRLAGRQARLHEPRFGDMAYRKQHEAALDAALTGWTRTQSKYELAERLRAAGLPAAPVRDSQEVLADPQLIERGHLVPVEHPETGVRMQSGVPVRMSRTPPGVSCHAPLLGQHSFEVFQRLLGMPRETYKALVRRGVSGTDPH